jgi:PAS domain S-box-containing protein
MTLVNSKLVIFIQAKFHSLLFILLVLIILLANRSPLPVFSQRAALSSLNQSQPQEPDLDNIKFIHLTSEDGLSSNRVTSILVDSKGYLWFGTFDGLNRYDGYEFQVFKHKPEDPNSLSANIVQVIYEDLEGTIWLGTIGGGLNRYDPRSESFTRYRHDPNDPQSLGSDRVFSIYQDRDGVLWIGTGGGGLNRYDPESDGFERFQHKPDDPRSLSNDTVRAIMEDADGEMLIGTDGGGLNHFDRQSRIFSAYRHDPDDPKSLGHDSVTNIYQDEDGIFWLSTWGGGLDRLKFEGADGESAHFTHFRYDPEDPTSLSHDSLFNIYEDDSGGIWIATLGGGLVQFDRSSEKFKSYQANPDDPYSLSHNSIISMSGDPNGLLWLGTSGGGVNILDLAAKAFRHYYSIPGEESGLNSNDIMGIYQAPDGTLWIGTGSGGLNKLDGQTRQVSHFKHDPNKSGSITDNMVREIVQDPREFLWLPTRRGLNRFDPSTGEASVYLNEPENPDSLLNNNVMTVYLAENGIIWAGTWSGLNRIDPISGEIYTYHQNPDLAEVLSGVTVISIDEDVDGTLWIGTFGAGLIQFDPQTEKLSQYKHNPDDPSSLSDNTVWNVYFDEAGRLWSGTGAGLDRFDGDSNLFLHYNENDGLPSAGVMSILEDDLPPELGGPNLWLSTTKGLTRFNPETGNVRNYDASDGLQGNDFVWSSAFKSPSGELYFGGTNGLTAFYPTQIEDNTHIPPLVITNLELAGEPVEISEGSVLEQAISVTDQLVLPYYERVISFEFTSLNYRAPKKNRYRYKLEGFDDQWTEVGSDRRFVTYTNLDPGQYTFRVIGSNNDSIWNEEGTSIEIKITPPWWETVWFRGGLFVMVLGLVGTGFVWQRRTANAQERRLESLLEERTRELSFAQTQLNTLFESSPLGIGFATMDGDIISANSAMAQIFGYSEEELLQRNVTDFFLSIEAREELLRRLENEEIIHLTPLELQRKDGSLFFATLTESKLVMNDQEVLLGVVNDISDRIRAEEIQKAEAEQAAITRERNRIARELHDSVTQSLYTSSLIAEALPDIWQTHPEQAAENLEEIRRINQGALAEMRTLLLELHPVSIADRSLGDLLRLLAEGMSARTNSSIIISTVGDCYMTTEVQLSLYRIAQEALNNVVKHARATKAWINLNCSAGQVTLRIRDNGRGFEIQEKMPDHLGLMIMHERAQKIDAELAITSQPDQGTQVQVIWRPS